MGAAHAQEVMDDDKLAAGSRGEDTLDKNQSQSQCKPSYLYTIPKCFDQATINKIEQRLLWARSAVGDSSQHAPVPSTTAAASTATSKYEIMGKIWGMCAAASLGISIGYTVAVAKAYKLGIPL